MFKVSKPVDRETQVHECFYYSQTLYTTMCVIFILYPCSYAGVNKEEPELAIATEENQDEEPTKAKKRK